MCCHLPGEFSVLFFPQKFAALTQYVRCYDLVTVRQVQVIWKIWVHFTLRRHHECNNAGHCSCNYYHTGTLADISRWKENEVRALVILKRPCACSASWNIFCVFEAVSTVKWLQALQESAHWQWEPDFSQEWREHWKETAKRTSCCSNEQLCIWRGTLRARYWLEFVIRQCIFVLGWQQHWSDVFLPWNRKQELCHCVTVSSRHSFSNLYWRKIPCLKFQKNHTVTYDSFLSIFRNMNSEFVENTLVVNSHIFVADNSVKITKNQARRLVIDKVWYWLETSFWWNSLMICDKFVPRSCRKNYTANPQYLHLNTTPAFHDTLRFYDCVLLWCSAQNWKLDRCAVLHADYQIIKFGVKRGRP